MAEMTPERRCWWNRRYKLMRHRLRDLRKDIDALSNEPDTRSTSDMDICFCGGAMAAVMALLEQARKSQVGK